MLLVVPLDDDFALVDLFCRQRDGLHARLFVEFGALSVELARPLCDASDERIPALRLLDELVNGWIDHHGCCYLRISNFPKTICFSS